MGTTRRQFLHAAVASGATLVGAPLLELLIPARAQAKAAVPPARVGVARRPGVLAKEGAARAAIVDAMVQQAVMAATGLGSPRDAFASLFRPDDVVGLKVNCLAGRALSTHPEVAFAIARGAMLAGVKPGNVIIWERSSRELARAGYGLQTGSTEVRVLASDGDYEREPMDAGSVGGCLATLASRTCTALVSVPVLKDHDLAGVSGALKNWYGAIHNPNKYHDNQCAPYVADLFGKSLLRQRARLAVCDALLAQCHGGPAFSGDFAWRYEGVLAALDPVALDATAARIIEAERKRRGLPSLSEAQRPPRWLQLAVQQGLGVADLAAIRLVEV